MEEFTITNDKGEEVKLLLKENPHFSKPTYDGDRVNVWHEDEMVPHTKKAWDATRPRLLYRHMGFMSNLEMYEHFEKPHNQTDENESKMSLQEQMKHHQPYLYYKKIGIDTNKPEMTPEFWERVRSQQFISTKQWIRIQTAINNQKQMNNNSGFISTQLKTVKSIEDYEKLLKWMIKNVPLPDRVAADDNKMGILASVLEFGLENGIGWAEALGQLIPTGDGRFMIKGDLAKAKIFGSGFVTKWEESISGSIEKLDYTYKITGTRTLTDNPVANTEVVFERSYSIQDAIKAGLYNPDAKGKDSEFWRDYPERMCMYRALGHLVRDFFGDVLRNMVLTEEYMDYKKTEGNTIVRQGHKLDMSRSTQQEMENKGVAKSITEKVNGSSDLDVDNSGDVDPKGAEVKDPVWTYKPETNNLSIRDRQDVTDKEVYILGSAVECTIEEGRFLKDAFFNKENPQDWVEKAKECETGVELIVHLDANAPKDLVDWVNLIDGRKTKNRLYELIDVYTEDKEQVAAYFMKTYPKVKLPGVEESPKAEESKHEPTSAKASVSEETLDKSKEEPKQEEKKESGNALGIEWGPGSPEDPRHFKTLNKVVREMSKHDNKLYAAFEDVFMEMHPDSSEDAEDAMITYPAGKLDEILNRALERITA